MKKLLYIALLFWAGITQAQISTGSEYEFDYGIRNLSTQTVTDPIFVTTQGTDGTYGKVTLENLQGRKAFLSTGLIKNGLISINADPTKYNVTAGIGVITNFDNPEAPTSTIVNFSAVTGHTPAYLNTGNITYIAINASGVIVESASQFTPIQRRDLIILGAVIHSNLTNINVVNNISAPSNSGTNQLHDFIEAVGPLNLTGNKYTANGANMQLNKSAGSIFKFGVNFANDWKSPHQLSQPSGTALTFRYRTQNGVEGSDRINLDPTLYDLNNVYTSVPNNKFVIETIVTFQTGITRILKGQNYYDDLASAKAAIFTRSFVIEPNSLENGIIRGYVIMRNTTTSLQSVTDAEIVEAQKFGGVASGGVALTFANIVTALGYTPENIANKQNSLVTDGTGVKYPTVDAVNAALPATYSNIVYVNATSPTTATIFDLNNPPVTNDNGLKINTSNLYIGTDASTWVYITSPAGYITKVVPATSNFFISATTTDAGNNKTASIGRVGNVSIGSTATSTAKLAITGTATGSGTVFNVTNTSVDAALGFAQFLSPNMTNSQISYVAFGKAASTNNRAALSYMHSADGSSSNAISFGFFGANDLMLIKASGRVLVGTATDDGINKVQSTGTISSGTTTLGNTPPTANNQLTRKDYVDTADALKAPIASPTFTGTPLAPTASPGTNTTQIATTAFVTAATGSGILEFNSTDLTVWNNGKGNILQNTSFGDSAMKVTTGSGVSGYGYQTLIANTTGSNNSSYGYQSMQANTTGFNNSAYGFNALGTNTTGENNAIFGFNSQNLGTGDVNSIVVGAGATGAGSNTATIGNTSIVKTVLRGVVTTGLYTVATLPTPTGIAYATVSDATAPTYLGTLTGGGAVVCPVFYDGTSWKSH